MTLTTPNCPAAGELPTMVENAVASVPGVGVVNVNLVWDPAWTPDRMTDEARLVLNMWSVSYTHLDVYKRQPWW